MIKYLLGLLKFLFHPGVSLFCKIDNRSEVDKKARINSNTQVFNSTIGKHSYLGRYSYLICAKIGNFCSIGDEVKVGLGIHTLDKLSTCPIFTEKYNGTGSSWVDVDSAEPFKQVTVGNDVWIGERVLVMGGVTIGDGAVIGAGAIVTKDVPPYTIVAGVPAKPIRKRFPDDVIAKLEELKWWDLPEEKLKEHITLFQQENVTVEELEKNFRNNEQE